MMTIQRKRGKKSWKELSPNTIVFEILTFLQYPTDLNMTKSFENDLGCFGYFELDKLKNLWFLFRSVKFGWEKEFGDPHPFRKFPVNLKKLEHLCITNLAYLVKIGFRKKYKKLIFHNLISLESQAYNNKCDILNFRFNKFPKLKRLTFSKYIKELPKVKWNHLPRLENLQICQDFKNGYDLFLEGCKFEKMKVLFLSSIRFNKTVYSVENLVQLKLYFSNITDQFFQREFPKLRILHLAFCKDLKGIGWNSTALSEIKDLYIRQCYSIETEFFMRYKFKKLKKFYLEKYHNMENVDRKFLSNFFPKTCKIRIIQLQ